MEVIGLLMILLAFYLVVVYKVTDLTEPNEILSDEIKSQVNLHFGHDLLTTIDLSPIYCMWDDTAHEPKQYLVTGTFKVLGRTDTTSVIIDDLSEANCYLATQTLIRKIHDAVSDVEVMA